jgi:hypothetical protein
MGGILIELELKEHEAEMFAAPATFAKRLLAKADELRQLLATPQSQSTKESEFRAAANGNFDAKKRADEIMNNLMDLLVNEDPMVVHHFSARISELQATCNNVVKSAAATFDNGEPTIDKPMVHAQYIELRKFYEAFRGFNAAIGQNFSIMPALPGNYKPKSGGTNIKSYVYEWDGKTFINHFSLVRELLKLANDTDRFADDFHTRQDCLDYFAANPQFAVVIKETK